MLKCFIFFILHHIDNVNDNSQEEYFMSDIKIEFTDDCIVSNAGLTIVAKFITRPDFKKRIDRASVKGIKRSESEFTDYEIIICYIALLCLGKTQFADVNFLKQGNYYKQILRLKRIPSEEIFRQRLEKMSSSVKSCLKEITIDLLREHSVLTRCLNTDYIPLDIDVSCLDNSGSKKEKVSYTYMDFMGYAPIFAYLGGTGFMLDHEFRAGKEHSNCAGTDKFISGCLEKAQSITGEKILFRLDSGNDSVLNYIVMASKPNSYYLAKHNLRRESREKYVSMILESDCDRKVEETKTTYFFSDYRDLKRPDNSSETFKTRRVIRLTQKTSDRKGQLLLIPENELDVWYTNLEEKHTALEIVQLYKDHGTCEQFHGELKTDLGVEKLPSGKFECNSLIMVMANFAYNLLKLIGQETLNSQQFKRKRSVQRIRIHTVLQNIMYFACRFMKKFNQKTIQISKTNLYKDAFCYVFKKFALIT